MPRLESDVMAGMTIDESARRLGHLRWVEQRLFETLGGWVPTTDDADAELLFARHSFHHAWHAELLGRCLPDTRDHEPDALTAPADDAWRALLDALRELDATPARLVAVYGVVVPWLLAEYDAFLGDASPVRDAPSIRWVHVVLADVQTDAADAAELLAAAEDRSEAADGRALARHLADGGVS
jgi:hypothetical protein